MSVTIVGHLKHYELKVKGIQKEEYEDAKTWNKQWKGLTSNKQSPLPIDFSQKKVILLQTNSSHDHLLTLQKVEDTVKNVLQLYVGITSFAIGNIGTSENISYSLILTVDKEDKVNVEPAGSNPEIEAFHAKKDEAQNAMYEKYMREIPAEEKVDYKARVKQLFIETHELKASLMNKYCGPVLPMQDS